MPVLLAPAHVAALHTAFNALLASSAVAPTERWARSIVATLGPLLGAWCATTAVLLDGENTAWYDDDSGPAAELRALAEPTRVPAGADVRQPSHDVAAWALDEFSAPPHPTTSGGAAGLPPRPRAAAGLLYETIGFRLHFACLLPAASDAHDARRTRALLDLVAPVLAAGARARAHAGGDCAPAHDGAPQLPGASPPLDTRAADALAAALADEYALTAREAQAARYLIQGCTNAVLARALGISENTARHHTERVIAKLGVRSRAEVAWVAVGRLGTPASGVPAVAAGRLRPGG